MKVKASIKPRCPRCKIVKRHRTVRVLCTANRRHKQRQG